MRASAPLYVRVTSQLSLRVLCLYECRVMVDDVLSKDNEYSIPVFVEASV
jgi:hypothetical protein